MMQIVFVSNRSYQRAHRRRFYVVGDGTKRVGVVKAGNQDVAVSSVLLA